MQHNSYLTFGINLNTQKISSCDRHPEEAGKSLSEFLKAHVSSAALNDGDVKFDYRELESFLARKGDDREMTVVSRADGRRYRFVAYPSRADENIVYCSMFISFEEDKSDRYIYDYLTGLYTCSYAVEMIEKRFSLVEQGTLCIIDLDNFKRVNVSFGRTAGDECLRKFAHDLKEIIHDSVVARYGGDEFIVWLENMSDEEAIKTIEKLLGISYTATEGVSRKAVKVTSCIGAASYPSAAASFEKLFYKADRALSKAKELGHNSAAFFGKTTVIANGRKDARRDRSVYRKEERLFGDEMKGVKQRCAVLCILSFIVLFAVGVIISVNYGLNDFVPFGAFMLILVALLGLLVACGFTFSALKINNMRLTYIDPVTSGINRTRLVMDAEKLIKKGKYAVVSVNTVHFKFVNEQLGREMANGILRKIYADIDAALSDDELVAREYADRFTLIVHADGHLKERISALLASLSENKYSGRGFSLKFTAGVYVLPEADVGNNANDLAVGFDRSLFALMQTDENENSIVLFNDGMLMKEIEGVEFEQRSEQALREGRFVVYYQMKRDIIRDSWCGAEALVRWIDPVLGMISPGKFIPVFERNGFIVELDKYVFYEVCRDIRADLDCGKNVLPISINVSRVHFTDDNFFDDYEEIMTRFSIPRHLIEFELTESIVMESATLLKKFLRRAHALGCKCSIDDFGSGYSSLNMLKEFDFDIVKFDRGFFYGDNGFDSDSQTIVFSLIKLSHDLGMKVVSEGIEREEQKDFLLKHKCDIVQGFLYSKPMPHSDYVKNLKNVALSEQNA